MYLDRVFSARKAANFLSNISVDKFVSI